MNPRGAEQVAGQPDGRVLVYHPLWAATDHPDPRYRPRPVATFKAREILKGVGWSQFPKKYNPDWTEDYDARQNARAAKADPDGLDLATLPIGELRDLYVARSLSDQFNSRGELDESWSADELRWELREMYQGNPEGTVRPTPASETDETDETDETKTETPEPETKTETPEPTVKPSGRRPTKKKATKKKAATKPANTAS